jgi:hypothetical protein
MRGVTWRCGRKSSLEVGDQDWIQLGGGQILYRDQRFRKVGVVERGLYGVRSQERQ